MPKIETRPEQRYVAKRAIMPMRDLATRIPALTSEVLAWLEHQGVAATGRPFLRYHVVDMPERMDVAVGIPVDHLPEADTGIDFGTLPAGRYATSSFTGVKNGVAANKALIDWIADQGKPMSVYTSEEGEVFEARYETVLTDANGEPDQSRWETEVAIKVTEKR